MFKKFKNKLAEEMKQSPARLQAGMQQLAQAVVSPSLSNSSIQDLPFKDNFSLTDETDDTPKNSPIKQGFETVDLTTSSANSNTSRRSSVSSNISDASFLFPIYENFGNAYSLQSDMDQSASEIDDNITSSQLDSISKEQLYAAYRKALTKYDKYRGRFTDLVTHYREMERSKIKLESLLVDTQDKGLRRISDLKEQCQLEQQAKAHLEDALRNDIEEKDHVINSLRIKIKLLQEKGANEEHSDIPNNTELSENHENKVGILVDLSNNTDSEKPSEESKLINENIQLKNKIQKMETFSEKYKEMLKRNKDKILEVTNEKNTLERDYDILQKSNQEKVDSLEQQLSSLNKQLINLNEEINVLKKREEESVISLAENKLSIHRELEGKEELIKQLQLELKQTLDHENTFKEIIEKQKQELDKVKLVANQNAEATQEHLRGKTEALNQMQSEMQKKLIDLEQKMGLKYHEEVSKNKELSIKLQELEQQSKTTQYTSEKFDKIIQELEEKKSLLIQMSTEKKEYQKLLNDHKTQNIHLQKELTETINTLENLKIDRNTNDNVLKTDYEKIIYQLKQEIKEKNEIYNELRLRNDKIIEEFEQYKHKFNVQEKEIVILKSKKNNDLEKNQEKMLKLQNELKNKNEELLSLTTELKSSSIIISNLKQEINSLINHKNNLIEYLKTYKKTFKNLREDHESLKNNVNSSILNGKRAILESIQETNKILLVLNEKEANLKFQIDELSKKTNKIEELKNNCNDNNVQLEQILNEKIHLEKELKHKYNEIEEMKMKIKNFNKVNVKNTTFALEIENLQSKLMELDKLNNKHKQLLYKHEVEKEDFLKNISLEKQQYEKNLYELNLKVAENKNLNDEVTNLSRKYKEAEKIIQTLKGENEDYNNVIKEMQNLNLKLNSVKEELEDKNQQLQNLQTKNYAEEQQLLKLKTKCENYQKTNETNNQKSIHLKKELNNSKEICKKLNIELEETKNSLQKTIDIKNSIQQELEQEKLKLKNAECDWIKSINSQTNENEQLRKCNTQLTTELNDFKLNESILDSLRKEKSDLICELDELKLLHDALNSENKSLKDNQNNLFNLNEELKQSQSLIMEQLNSLEKKNREIENTNSGFLKEIESNKYQLQCNISEMDCLKNQLKESEEIKNKNLIDEIEKRNKLNESLSLEVKCLQNQILDFNQCKVNNENLTHELEACKSKIIELENSASLKNESLVSLCNNSQNENHNLKIELEEKNKQIKENESKNDQLLKQVNELSLLKLNIEESVTEQTSKWSEVINKLENSLSNKESELKILQEKYAKLEENLKNTSEEKLKNIELNKNIQNITLEKDKLESQLDETLVTFQAKETQMQTLHEELKNQVIRLKEQMKNNEEEQNIRLKQIVKEFQAQLYDKENELQAALAKRFDCQQNYESDTIQEYKEQLKDFQIELTKKSEQIERLILDNEEIKTQTQKEIEKHLSDISYKKLEHAEEMQNIDKKWKQILKQKTNQLEIKHEQEVAELTQEWQNERKSDENTDLLNKELENTTKVAMAAVQSNTGSFHTLQQTLLSQKRELAELRKLVKMRQDSVEDSTEIEYLRNILYKYMMGKETMVLAKVIAAVVKFDQDQTSKILKKEEDKLSLLGSLGLT